MTSDTHLLGHPLDLSQHSIGFLQTLRVFSVCLGWKEGIQLRHPEVHSQGFKLYSLAPNRLQSDSYSFEFQNWEPQIPCEPSSMSSRPLSTRWAGSPRPFADFSPPRPLRAYIGFCCCQNSARDCRPGRKAKSLEYQRHTVRVFIEDGALMCMSKPRFQAPDLREICWEELIRWLPVGEWPFLSYLVVIMGWEPLTIYQWLSPLSSNLFTTGQFLVLVSLKYSIELCHPQDRAPSLDHILLRKWRNVRFRWAVIVCWLGERLCSCQELWNEQIPERLMCQTEGHSRRGSRVRPQRARAPQCSSRSVPALRTSTINRNLHRLATQQKQHISRIDLNHWFHGVVVVAIARVPDKKSFRTIVCAHSGGVLPVSSQSFSRYSLSAYSSPNSCLMVLESRLDVVRFRSCCGSKVKRLFRTENSKSAIFCDWACIKVFPVKCWKLLWFLFLLPWFCSVQAENRTSITQIEIRNVSQSLSFFLRSIFYFAHGQTLKEIRFWGCCTKKKYLLFCNTTVWKRSELAQIGSRAHFFSDLHGANLYSYFVTILLRFILCSFGAFQGLVRKSSAGWVRANCPKLLLVLSQSGSVGQEHKPKERKEDGFYLLTLKKNDYQRWTRNFLWDSNCSVSEKRLTMESSCCEDLKDIKVLHFKKNFHKGEFSIFACTCFNCCTELCTFHMLFQLHQLVWLPYLLLFGFTLHISTVSTFRFLSLLVFLQKADKNALENNRKLQKQETTSWSESGWLPFKRVQCKGTISTLRVKKGVPKTLHECFCTN